MSIVSNFTSRLSGWVGYPRRRSSAAAGVDSQTPEPGAEPHSLGPIKQYGPNDPVADAQRFIWRCGCGEQPSLHLEGFDEPQAPAHQHEDSAFRSSTFQVTGFRVTALPLDAGAGNGRFHVVRCSYCGRHGSSAEMPWEAITAWNRANLAVGSPLDRYPFFELEGLEPREARAKLMGIRTDLETQRVKAKLRQREGKDIGRRHRERLDAYLRWIVVAQALAGAQARVLAPGHRTPIGQADDGQVRPDAP